MSNQKSLIKTKLKATSPLPDPSIISLSLLNPLKHLPSSFFLGNFSGL